MLKQHEIEVRVRYEESDPMGFLYYGNYFTYFEMGRTELLRASGGNYREMEAGGLRAVIVEAQCRYHQPARYDDLLTVQTTVTRVTAARIQYEHRVFRGEDLLAIGHTTLAIVDSQGNIKRVPESMQLG